MRCTSLSRFKVGRWLWLSELSLQSQANLGLKDLWGFSGKKSCDEHVPIPSSFSIFGVFVHILFVYMYTHTYMLHIHVCVCLCMVFMCVGTHV